MSGMAGAGLPASWRARLARGVLYALLVVVFVGPFWAFVMTAFSGVTIAPGRLLLWPEMPTLDNFRYAWVEAKVRHALAELLPVWTESAALSIARDLHAEMPELLSLALDEVHRQRRDKRRG